MSDCCIKKKERSSEEKKALLNRINRIEGQVRGIAKMIEEDVYCIDVLVQMSAIISAMESLGSKILCEHIGSCVVEGVKSGDLVVIDELENLIKKYIKI